MALLSARDNRISANNKIEEDKRNCLRTTIIVFIVTIVVADNNMIL